MWDSRSFHRTSLEIQKAHPEELTCIRALRDGTSLVTRSLKGDKKDDESKTDASLKLWDVRKPKEPVFAWTEGSLINMFA
mmetsp:Transcript_2118/g.3178  ORF Transcript_2118/g.3178 Transcript_2118/m.3178 type:complete len:80 (-) Transcript_2118:51-290(-)